MRIAIDAPIGSGTEDDPYRHPAADHGGAHDMTVIDLDAGVAVCVVHADYDGPFALDPHDRVTARKRGELRRLLRVGEGASVEEIAGGWARKRQKHWHPARSAHRPENIERAGLLADLLEAGVISPHSSPHQSNAELREMLALGLKRLEGAATFTSDSFTDTAGTTLASHTGETGAAWTLGPTSDSTAVISNLNRVRSAAAGSQTAGYWSSGVPAASQYDVQATLVPMSVAGRTGVSGRRSVSAETMYLFRYSTNAGVNRWELFKAVASTFTLLGSATQTLTAGNSYVVKGEIRTATKKLYVDTVEKVSSADDSVTGAGRAGLRLTDAGADGSGIHLDTFSATDFTPPPANIVGLRTIGVVEACQAEVFGSATAGVAAGGVPVRLGRAGYGLASAGILELGRRG